MLHVLEEPTDVPFLIYSVVRNEAHLGELLKLRGRGLRFGEVPLVLRYDEKGSASKMNVWRTTWQTLLLLLRRRLG